MSFVLGSLGSIAQIKVPRSKFVQVQTPQEQGTLILNYRRSERGQSGSFFKVYLFEPSAPPQVTMTLESKCKVRIESEATDPAGATLGLSMYSSEKLPLCPLPDPHVVECQTSRFASAKVCLVECHTSPFAHSDFRRL